MLKVIITLKGDKLKIIKGLQSIEGPTEDSLAEDMSTGEIVVGTEGENTIQVIGDDGEWKTFDIDKIKFPIIIEGP